MLLLPRREDAPPRRGSGGDRCRGRRGRRRRRQGGQGRGQIRLGAAAAAADPADLLPAPRRPAGQGLRPRSPGVPQVRRRHQHRGDVADARRRALRDRRGLLEAKGLQPARGHGRAAGVPRVQGRGRPARRAGGPHGPGDLLAPVHRAGLPRRAAPGVRARDPADEPVERRAAAQVARRSRGRHFQV